MTTMSELVKILSRRPGWLLVAAVIGIVAIGSPAFASPLICNESADFALGLEDYPEAIRLHQEVLRQRPDNALAHYHLGYAYGVTGDSAAELREYLKAQELGLRTWDFYLNLGLLRLDRREFRDAIAALSESTRLGPTHPEAHFNLGLAYERAGMLARAADEISASLKLDSAQPDAENELAAVYAEMGRRESAREIWTRLVEADPSYQPAARNLAILRASDSTQLGVALLNSGSTRRDP
jgi:tetratricopeptide (TPR) repeat protein